MAFKCRENCGKCCGPVPVTPETYEKHKGELGGHYAVCDGLTVFAFREGGVCAFLTNDKKCRIYDERPGICRDFGTRPYRMMQCPYVRPDGTPRSRGERRAMLHDMHRHTERFLRRLERENDEVEP